MTLPAGFAFPRPDDVIAEIERPFTLYQPALQVVPVIVDVPHAGRRYPRVFVRRDCGSGFGCGDGKRGGV